MKWLIIKSWGKITFSSICRPGSGPLVSQCVIPRPALIPLAINNNTTITTNNNNNNYEETTMGRLPGTFDSLSLVTDTGVTPSPRPETPLVLLPGGGALGSVLSRRFLSSSYLHHSSGSQSGIYPDYGWWQNSNFLQGQGPIKKDTDLVLTPLPPVIVTLARLMENPVRMMTRV